MDEILLVRYEELERLFLKTEMNFNNRKFLGSLTRLYEDSLWYLNSDDLVKYKNYEDKLRFLFSMSKKIRSIADKLLKCNEFSALIIGGKFSALSSFYDIAYIKNKIKFYCLKNEKIQNIITQLIANECVKFIEVPSVECREILDFMNANTLITIKEINCFLINLTRKGKMLLAE